MIGKITLIKPIEIIPEGYVYKVNIGAKYYIGSTKLKLSQRANKHNYHIKTKPKCKFHIECVNNNIFKVKCEEIYKGKDYLEIENNIILESLNDPNCLNMKAVKSNKERRRKQNNIKTECRLCGKVIMKKNMRRHLRQMHNVTDFDFICQKVKV